MLPKEQVQAWIKEYLATWGQDPTPEEVAVHEGTDPYGLLYEAYFQVDAPLAERIREVVNAHLGHDAFREA